MSIVGTLALTLSVVETLTIPDALAANAAVTHNQWNVTRTLNSGSPATQVASNQKTMSAGAGTIDLRAVPGTNGAAIDGNGLKVQAFLLQNPATNANDITIEPGASNGYALFKGGGGITLSPGASALFDNLEKLADIDATHKTIDISGTGAQILNYVFVLG